MNMKISSRLRLLLTDPAAKEILNSLWKEKDQKNVLVYLTTTDNCISDYAERYYADQWLPNKFIDECYAKFDGPFFNELKKAGIIKHYSFTQTELPDQPPGPEYQACEVAGIDNSKLKYLLAWVKQLPYILNHGNFSLNTMSGEAYFKDKAVKLYKNSGYFKLIKSFLESKDTSLSVKDILQISGRGVQSSKVTNDNYYDALEIIKNLGRRIGIRKNLNKIIPYTGNVFVLTA